MCAQFRCWHFMEMLVKRLKRSTIALQVHDKNPRNSLEKNTPHRLHQTRKNHANKGCENWLNMGWLSGCNINGYAESSIIVFMLKMCVESSGGGVLFQTIAWAFLWASHLCVFVFQVFAYLACSALTSSIYSLTSSSSTNLFHSQVYFPSRVFCIPLCSNLTAALQTNNVSAAKIARCGWCNPKAARSCC